MIITIDNKKYNLQDNLNLLQNLNNLNIPVPHLCGIKSPQKKIACELCIILVNDEIMRACETFPQLNMTIKTTDQRINLLRKNALDKIMSDHYADCQAPCQIACPAKVDIQTYLYLIASNNHQKAVEIIKQTLPMPLSIGRICPAFCETQCRRALVDEPIAIRQLKRHAADIDLQANLNYIPPKKEAKTQHIAIVGAGPGGLSCGYYLSNEGYQVTVFEDMPKAGGWLRYGIPEYRLPKNILDKEIEIMCANGMNIETNKKLGIDFTLTALSENYDAVCLAIGATKAVAMQYPGSELIGCFLGVNYLKDFVTSKTYKTGKKVAIIGGGNTAIDCARTAVRMGAQTTLIYRRTRAEMPAENYEISEAEHEGVNFLFLTNPVENIADTSGRVCAIRLEKMNLGEPDFSGRRSPKATGDFFEQDFDTVIYAISQKPDLDFLDNDNIELPLTKYFTQNCDPKTMYSGIKNIFSIGDFRLGPATAIEAIADGKIAANSIIRFFSNKLNDLPIIPYNSQKENQLKNIDKTQFSHYPKFPRIIMPELNQKLRVSSFNEVELGFNNEEAIREAAKCLECACQINTDCRLRDYSTQYQAEILPELDSKKQKFIVDSSSEFIVFDPNRCISCGQCVQTCTHENVHSVLNFCKPESEHLVYKPEHRVGFGLNPNMKSSKCVQCGSCVQVCPTGALVDKRYKSQGNTQTFVPINTICTYCGVGCKITMFVDEENNKLHYIKGADSIVNEQMLCVKGRFGFDFIQSEERLTTPLIRKKGNLEKSSWDEAITLIGNKFNEIKQNYGSDALAGLASSKATNEDNYLFQKLIRREFGTNNLDHCARLCHASTITGLESSIGSAAMTNDIPSIKNSDLIFIIGSDTSAAHPIIASHIKRVVQSKTARLIVADPKKIEIADFAQLYISQRPGTDVMLLNGIMQIIIKNNWHDKAYIEKNCINFPQLRDEVLKSDYSPEKVELVTTVNQSDLYKMAKMIGTAKHTAVYYSMGITQHTTGHDNVRSLANLQMLCGNIGVEGAGINPLRGQSNIQGTCDMGALPNSYPGYQKVYDKQNYEKFSKAWDKKELPQKEGLSLMEIMQAAGTGEIKGLYIMGENPALSDPDETHILQILEKINFLVVQDIFLTETAKYADVVLPAYSFAEKSGHFTNTERRVQRINPALKAPGLAKEDWIIIQLIANAMGANWNYTDVSQITNEICSVTPQYAGITWDRITNSQNGLQWPCPDENHPGTRILHTSGIIKGKGEMIGVSFKYASELTDENYPFILTTGRLLEQFHTGTMTRKTRQLDNLAGPQIMISHIDAEILKIKNSEIIKITTRRGSITAPAFVTKRIQAGVIFIPFHFAESPANRLTNPAKDQKAKIPEFKVAAAKIEKI